MDLTPLWLSFEVALAATCVTAVVGIALGAMLTWKKLPARDLIDAILTAPLVLPPTVLGYYLLVALGRRSPIGHAWEAVFGHTIVFTRTGAVAAAVVGSLPLVTSAARTALAGVEPTLLAAARTLGARPWRVFVTVALPLAAPGILGGCMVAFARALGDFGVTLMVAGDIPGETQTASLAIYDAIQANREGDAIGMILILTAVAIFLLWSVNKLARRSRGH